MSKNIQVQEKPLLVPNSPFVDSFSPEDSWVLVEFGSQLAIQLVADVAARHAVPGGDAGGEDNEGHGEYRVATQDLLLNCQQLLGLAEVTWGAENHQLQMFNWL